MSLRLRPITQRQGVILSLPALHNGVGTHLSARMSERDPASSETTGIISKDGPTRSND